MTPHRHPRQRRNLAVLIMVLASLGLGSASIAQETVPKKDGTAVATPNTKPASQLTVASYNLYNMFDVFDDPYTDDDGTRVKPRAEIVQIASALRAIDADVIAVQEVENEGILRAMVQQMLPKMGYKHVLVMPTNSTRGGNVGLISRRPIVRASSHRWTNFSLPGSDRTWRFARDLLQVTIAATDKHTIDFFVVHLKSKRTVGDDKNSANWRLAEATQIRKVMDARLKKQPDALFCLLGDCNDDPESPPIQAMLADHTSPKDGVASRALIDVHTGLDKEARITYRSKRYGNSTLDYVLASPALAKRAVKGSARVISDKALIAGSDHAPLVVTFDLK